MGGTFPINVLEWGWVRSYFCVKYGMANRRPEGHDLAAKSSSTGGEGGGKKCIAGDWFLKMQENKIFSIAL